LSSKFVKLAKEFLTSTATENTDIDMVLLSGNMHAWLKPMIQSIFPGKLLSGVDPSEAIAIGCTIQANWNISHGEELISKNIPPALDVQISPIAIAIGKKDNIVIERGTPLPALINYDLASMISESEEEKSLQLDVWQVNPTEKHLATLNDLSVKCSIRMLLTETKKLRIAVNGESIVIG